MNDERTTKKCSERFYEPPERFIDGDWKIRTAKGIKIRTIF